MSLNIGDKVKWYSRRYHGFVVGEVIEIHQKVKSRWIEKPKGGWGREKIGIRSIYKVSTLSNHPETNVGTQRKRTWRGEYENRRYPFGETRTFATTKNLTVIEQAPLLPYLD